MKKRFFLLLAFPIFYLGTGSATAQLRYSQLQSKTISVMGQAFGPELLGLYLKYNLSNMFAAHAGIGLLGDFHLGGNFYFATNRYGDLNLYLGPQIFSVEDYQHGLFSANDPGHQDRQRGFYAPIGVEYLGSKGFTLQLEAGPSYTKAKYDQLNTAPFQFAIRMGQTFLRR